MKKLESKKIIITGGSLGIGLAIAKKCASEGAEVIIAARNEDALQEASEEINAISEKNHHFYSLDVGNLNSVNKLPSKILLDILISLYGESRTTSRLVALLHGI